MELTQIPKIELHLHLDGAVPPETMWRMAQEKGLALPADTLEDFRTWLVRTADCRDVNTYLARFELPLQLMQDAPSIERITFDVLSTRPGRGMSMTRSASPRSCIRGMRFANRTRSRPCWPGGRGRCAHSRTTAAGSCSAACASGRRRSTCRKICRRSA